MNQIISGFKNNLLDTIFKVAGKTWKQITGAYLIYFGATVLIFIIAAILLIGGNVDFSELTSITDSSDFEEIFRNLGDHFFSSEMIIFMVIAFIYFMIVGSWIMYFSFLSIDETIKQNKPAFSKIFSASFNRKIFRVLGATLLLYIILLIGFAIAVFVGSSLVLGAIVLGLFVMIFNIRFVLTLPAYVIGGMDIFEAIKVSFESITMVRAIKIFGALLLAMLALLVTFLLIGLVTTVFAFIPILGQLIQIAVQVLIGSFMMALSVSFMLGLYYRYNDIGEVNSEITEGASLDSGLIDTL